jgi:hypothetical protein
MEAPINFPGEAMAYEEAGGESEGNLQGRIFGINGIFNGISLEKS